MSEVRLNMTELLRIQGDLPWNAEQIIRSLAFAIEGKAKENIRMIKAIDTGAMRASVFTKTRRDDPTGRIAAKVAAKNSKAEFVDLPAVEGDIIAVVGCGVDYGIYVEYGTQRVEARPWFNPAVMDGAGKLNDGSTWRDLVGPRLGEAQPPGGD